MTPLLSLYLVLFLALLLFYLTTTPFSFGTNDGSANSTDSGIFQIKPYQLWITGVVLGVSSIAAILLYIVRRVKNPEHFSRFSSYQFGALTTFMIGQILSISFIPQEFLGDNFPISTEPFTDLDNKTQWVLNIGGPSRETNQENWSGIQIPIYVIIAGILGAYIRYLYQGIKEFKELFKRELSNLEENDRYVELARSTYSRFSGREFRSIKEEANTDDQDFKDIPPDALSVYGQHKDVFFRNVQQAQSKFEKNLFDLRFDVINHTLYTVGFFFLAPLLAILAWLFLSISGTNSQATFALVSFAIGLTTKTIVDRITSFVEENVGTSRASSIASTAVSPISSTTKLIVKATNENNFEIKGCLTTLTIEGSPKTGLTPFTFEGVPLSKEIIVTVEDYQDGKFAKWENDSTIRERRLTLAADMIITAIYNTVTVSPSSSLSPSITPSPAISRSSTTATLSSPSSPEPPTIFLYPQEGKVGQELYLAISGKGFATNSKIDLKYSINGITKQIADSVPTTDKGEFVAPVKILPESSGVYIIEAMDEKGNSETRTITIN